MAGVRGRRSGLWLVAVLLTALPAGAQTLDEVNRHLRDGRMQEARSALLAWERATDRPGRLDRQRALWFKGLLTLDPEQAAASYMRLVVEYPGGPFTDRALLRLAMAADVRGDTEEAAEHYTRLARDHPASPLGDDARAWLQAHPDALAAIQQDGEEEAAGSRPQTRDGVFAVQLGAFSAPDGAEALADRARDAGFDVRTVRLDGDPFYRVRAGRFQDRTAAEQLRDRIRAAGFDATLSANADREQGRG